ncbi:MAG TPA: helix-turn-helix transcriptional regulator, partial [Ktedonobacterales bacterium]
MTRDHTSASTVFTWQAEWGLLLRMTRQVAGMTLAELSARSGISKGYLSKLESGHPSARNPSRATLAGLERALPGLSPLAHMLGPEPAGPVVTLE